MTQVERVDTPIVLYGAGIFMAVFWLVLGFTLLRSSDAGAIFSSVAALVAALFSLYWLRRVE